jgi:hypothetical protein
MAAIEVGGEGDGLARSHLAELTSLEVGVDIDLGEGRHRHQGLAWRRRILTGLTGEGAGLIQLAFSEARHSPELVQAKRKRSASAVAISAARWGPGWRRDCAGADDIERAAMLCITMISDQSRIRIAMG